MPDVAVAPAVALAAFMWTYVGLALGRIPGLRVDRTGVAIIGAAVMVVTGVIPWDRAVAAVDAHTLALLFGMMIVSAYLRLSGFFHLVTVSAVRRARTPRGLLLAVAAAAGLLSALFVNDVICLVLAPIVLLVADLKRPDRFHYVLLKGNPRSWLVWGGFILLAFGVLLAAWLLAALAGGRGALLGLLTGRLFAWASAAAALYRPAVLTVVTAGLSNLVSNVPAGLLFKSVVPMFGEPARGWLVRAMASTLAGNLTLLGSVANLIVVEVARGQRVRVGFLEYCRVGVPVTLVSLLVGWLILSLAPL